MAFWRCRSRHIWKGGRAEGEFNFPCWMSFRSAAKVIRSFWLAQADSIHMPPAVKVIGAVVVHSTTRTTSECCAVWAITQHIRMIASNSLRRVLASGACAVRQSVCDGRNGGNLLKTKTQIRWRRAEREIISSLTWNTWGAAQISY